MGRRLCVCLCVHHQAVATANNNSDIHTARHGIDTNMIESLQLGEYQVTIDVDGSTHSIQVAERNPVTVDHDNRNSALLPPLLVTLLQISEGSAFLAQHKSELIAFLKTLGARGSFEWFAHPIVATTSSVPRVLTIAGSDSGGGAGIQADMKACTNLGVFSTTAITAVTVQNTRGVHGIHAIPVNEISDQITCVLNDIGTDVVKTGMLFNEEIIDMVARILGEHQLPLVVDPVMVSTSGHRLLKEAAHASMVKNLFPLATIITPNIPETSALLHDRVIESVDEMKQAARDLAVFGPSFVLVKGGHLTNPQNGLVHDVLLDVQRDEFHVITNPKLSTRNTHGTGCTLAAAIAAQFAKTRDMVVAVKTAVAYLHGILVDSQELAIGGGDSGPMLHVM